ncbi:hypothetical protein [Streptomyces olivaceiscleroticus]|uniref:Translation elongation factor EFTu/EF1A C-terminal domain-containing protein n=1 Tax=Streptomyces olivaceiscleroticus TaxID=68245 RepID=A0ABP3JCC6_9ACTN
MKPYSNFTAALHVLSKEEGGRQGPIVTGFRPEVYVRTVGLTASMELPEGVEMVSPGEDVLEV